MYYLYDSEGNKVNCKIKYVRRLFGISYVEVFGRTNDFEMGDVFILKDDSGNEVFKGFVGDIKEKGRGAVEVYIYSYFQRMAMDYRAVKYSGKYNYEIVEDLIALYNGITESDFGGVDYSNVDKTTDGVSIEFFAVRERVLGEIIKLYWLSGWFFSDKYEADVNGDLKWFAYPLKEVDTGKVYKEGKNVLTSGDVVYVGVRNKKVESNKVINKIIVKGRGIDKVSMESLTVADGSAYGTYGMITTAHKIKGNVKITDSNGNQIEVLKVYNESKIILVDSSYVGDTFNVEYVYDDSNVVILKDNNSIAKYGVRVKVENTDLYDTESLSAYGQKVLDIFANPPIQLQVNVQVDEWELLDKITLKLNNGDGTYNEYDFVVYEKIWNNGNLNYYMGSKGKVFEVLQGVLSSFKVNLSLLEIYNISNLQDDVSMSYKVVKSYVNNVGYEQTVQSQAVIGGYGDTKFLCSGGSADNSIAVLKLVKGYSSIVVNSDSVEYDFANGDKIVLYKDMESGYTNEYMITGVGKIYLDYAYGSFYGITSSSGSILKVELDTNKLDYGDGVVVGMIVGNIGNLADGTNIIEIFHNDNTKPIYIGVDSNGNLVLADETNSYTYATYDSTVSEYVFKIFLDYYYDSGDSLVYIKAGIVDDTGVFQYLTLGFTADTTQPAITVNFVANTASYEISKGIEFSRGSGGSVSDIEAFGAEISIVRLKGDAS